MVVLRWIGYLWALPLVLLGIPVALLCGPQHVRWADGALEVRVLRLLGFKGTTGQTWGFMCLLKATATDQDRRHEHVHVGQALLLGVLFIPAYVGHFLWLLAFTPSEPASWGRLRRAYWWIWAEVAARKAARAEMPAVR